MTRAEKQIRDHLPAIVESMIALSLGVKCTDTNIVTGQLTVYDKPPDRAAGQYLIDRIMGKPTERQELSGPDGAPLELSATVQAQSAKELAQWRKQQIENLSSGASASLMQGILSTSSAE